MIIVRAASFEEAHEIAMGDPFHAEGLREFDIWNWSMNEGQLHRDDQLFGPERGSGQKASIPMYYRVD